MVPAVVVGANLNALGVARSLRAGGVPVVVLGTSRREPAMWSRGCRCVLVTSLHGPDLIRSLLELRRGFAQDPVLFLTDEMSVFTLSAHRAELEGCYRFTLPSAEMVLALADKGRFHALAQDNGLPVPRSVVLAGMADLPKLYSLACPVVVKPADKRPVYLGRAERIHRAETPAEAERLCATMLRGAGSLVVQEWIPGPDSDILFCLFYAGRRGEIVSLFTGRKLRCDPPDIGSTGICVAAPEAAPALEAVTRRFAMQVGFAGMGSLEFKRHGGRDAFLAIEPTVGRSDWQEEIATLCGENIPLAAYGHELGLVPQAPAVRRNLAWRASAAQRWPRGVPRVVEGVRDGLWRLGDPMPGLCALADLVLRRLKPAPFRRARGPGRPRPGKAAP